MRPIGAFWSVLIWGRFTVKLICMIVILIVSFFVSTNYNVPVICLTCDSPLAFRQLTSLFDLVPLYMFKPASDFYWPFQGGVSFVDPFFLIFVIRLSLLYWFVCSLQPCNHLQGKGWLLGSLVCDVSLLLSLSHMVSRVKVGSLLYRFLIVAFFFTWLFDIRDLFHVYLNNGNFIFRGCM